MCATCGVSASNKQCAQMHVVGEMKIKKMEMNASGQ